jgi:hypothetical protein
MTLGRVDRGLWKRNKELIKWKESASTGPSGRNQHLLHNLSESTTSTTSSLSGVSTTYTTLGGVCGLDAGLHDGESEEDWTDACEGDCTGDEEMEHARVMVED